MNSIERDIAYHARAEKNLRRALPYAPDVDTLQVLVDRLRQHSNIGAQLRRINGAAMKAQLIGGAVKKAQAKR